MRTAASRAVMVGVVVLLSAVARAATVNVAVGPGFSFTPAAVTIAPGDTVQWTWAGAAHSSTSDTATGPETWNSGILSTGTFSHTFTAAGDWPYYCTLHSFPGGTSMNGVVHVVAAPAATPTITTITPASAPSGAMITITGTGFQNGATVTVGGTASALVTFVSATTIQAAVPNLPAGPAAVKVTNPDAQSATSTAFIVIAVPAIPILSPLALAALIAALGLAIAAGVRRA